ATVIRTEDAAVIVVEQSPRRSIQRRRVGGVEDDVVEHIIVTRAEVGKKRPRISSVLGNEKLSRTGPQQDAVGIAGIVGQAAHVAAFGPDQLPVGRKGKKVK